VLASASREGLSKAGLPAALVDVLLHAYNGALCMAVVCTQGECNILCLAASVSGTFVKILQLGTHHSNNSSLFSLNSSLKPACCMLCCHCAACWCSTRNLCQALLSKLCGTVCPRHRTPV
jgi:hypothetical protein